MAANYATIDPELERKAQLRQQQAATGLTVLPFPKQTTAPNTPIQNPSNPVNPANSVNSDSDKPAIPLSDNQIPMQGARSDIAAGYQQLPGMDNVYKKGNSYTDLNGIQKGTAGTKGLSVLPSPPMGMPAMDEQPAGLQQRVNFNAGQQFDRAQIQYLIARATNDGYTSEGSADNYRQWKAANKTLDTLLDANKAKDQLTLQGAQMAVGQNEFDANARQRDKQMGLQNAFDIYNTDTQRKNKLDELQYGDQNSLRDYTIKAMRELRAIKEQEANANKGQVFNAKEGERPYIMKDGKAEYIDIADKAKERNLAVYQQRKEQYKNDPDMLKYIDDMAKQQGLIQ